jgi:hypothetical protein
VCVFLNLLLLSCGVLLKNFLAIVLALVEWDLVEFYFNSYVFEFCRLLSFCFGQALEVSIYVNLTL